MPIDLTRKTGLRYPWSTTTFVLAIAFLVGMGLRLIWTEDIEYKFDERDYFLISQQAVSEGVWPILGPPSSTGVQAPGGTYGIFVFLIRVTGADSPPGLARACQVLNLVAILGFIVFVWRCVPPGEKERWQWGLALACVNPILVLLQRKIWNPSVTPIFLLVALWGWWHRARRSGAFLWGFVSVFIGQIHIAGFFLAAGFAVWALLFDRRNVRWVWWMAGAVLAVATLIPWLNYMLNQTDTHAASARKWGNLFTLQFWNRWVQEPLGISLRYSLGNDFNDFLSYPIVNGMPTYLVAGLHLAMLILGGAILVRALTFAWIHRNNWKDVLIGRGSQTALAIMSCLVGFGFVMSATLLPVHRHYMLLAFPFPFIWLASISLVEGTTKWLSQKVGRRLLVGLIIVHAAISFSFLHYVHVNQRNINGDYGTPYRAQMELGLPEK